MSRRSHLDSRHPCKTWHKKCRRFIYSGTRHVIIQINFWRLPPVGASQKVDSKVAQLSISRLSSRLESTDLSRCPFNPGSNQGWGSTPICHLQLIQHFIFLLFRSWSTCTRFDWLILKIKHNYCCLKYIDNVYFIFIYCSVFKLGTTYWVLATDIY